MRGWVGILMSIIIVQPKVPTAIGSLASTAPDARPSNVIFDRAIAGNARLTVTSSQTREAGSRWGHDQLGGGNPEFLYTFVLCYASGKHASGSLHYTQYRQADRFQVYDAALENEKLYLVLRLGPFTRLTMHELKGETLDVLNTTFSAILLDSQSAPQRAAGGKISGFAKNNDMRITLAVDDGPEPLLTFLLRWRDGVPTVVRERGPERK